MTMVVMRKREATFVKGLIGDDILLHDGTPVVAFFGRSNVGKSSVINSLLGVRGLVKTSKTPGRTQQLNVFLVNRDTYFIDFPGYGFAKMPIYDREKIEKRMHWYLTDAPRPTWTVLIIDAKVGPTRLDYEMLDVMRSNGHHVIVVANKVDKVSVTARAQLEEDLRSALCVDEIVMYSARTDEGKNKLFQRLSEYES